MECAQRSAGERIGMWQPLGPETSPRQESGGFFQNSLKSYRRRVTRNYYHVQREKGTQQCSNLMIRSWDKECHHVAGMGDAFYREELVGWMSFEEETSLTWQFSPETACLLFPQSCETSTSSSLEVAFPPLCRLSGDFRNGRNIPQDVGTFSS